MVFDKDNHTNGEWLEFLDELFGVERILQEKGLVASAESINCAVECLIDWSPTHRESIARCSGNQGAVDRAAKPLKKTIDGMLSDDYKERFKAEYQQTKIRYRKLCDLVNRIEVAADYLGVEPPKHDCPRALLEHQLSVMSEYLFTLQKRAIIERIDLDTLED